jgi:uncharacterized protein
MEHEIFPPQQPPPPQPLYNRYLEVGRTGKTEFWRYIVGFIIIFFGGYVILGQIPLFFIVHHAESQGYISANDPEASAKILNPAIMHVDANLIFLAEMFIFVMSMAALIVVVKYIHRKKLITLITSAPSIRWKRMWTAFGVWTVLNVITMGMALLLYPKNFHVVFQLKPFLISLVLALIFLPIQTWFEEFFFRGYIFQRIGQATKTALWPVLITGTVFGLIHLLNPEAEKYGALTVLPQYLLPGLILGLMVAFEEGLEVAMGYHFANNLFGTVAVTSANSAIQANTIWVSDGMLPTFDTLALIFQSFAFLAICWYMYKWNIKKLIH